MRELTQTEKVVLELSEGNTYKTVAKNLQISEQTVRDTMGRIFIKLDVHCKSDALRRAKRKKFIPFLECQNN